MGDITKADLELAQNPFAEQLIGINRQQALANALLQQGMQTPQGQMVSGRYVKPSPLQNISNLANILVGTYAQKQLDKKQLNLQNEMQQAEANAMATYLKLKEGTPGKQAVSEFIPQGGTLRDDDGNLMPGARLAAPAVPEVPGNIEAANLYGAQQRYAPFLRQMAQKKLMEDPIWERTSIKQNGLEIQGVYDKRNPDVMATFRPYNASADIPLATAQYSGIVPTGTQTGVPLSVRNNNPGNLVAPNGQFQQFPTADAGQNALINDLTLKVSGQSPAYKARFGNEPVTPARLAEVWSPANAKGNTPASTTNYGSFIAQKLGIGPNDPIPNNPQTIARVGQAITEFEKGAYGQPSQQSSKYDLQMPASFTSQKAKDEWIAKSQEPLTGEAAKKADGAVTTLNALDNYKRLIDTYSKEQVLLPDARAKLNEAHSQLMLQLKDANGLGVLNKGDLPMLEKLIVNPTNMETLLISKKVLESQIGNQKAFMRDVAANAYLNNYKEIPPRIKQTLMNVDADVEKATAQKDVAKAANLQKPVIYNSMSSAEAAGKSGRLKDGQVVVIGDKKFTWRND